jgi:hypothetical protein
MQKNKKKQKQKKKLAIYGANFCAHFWYVFLNFQTVKDPNFLPGGIFLDD